MVVRSVGVVVGLFAAGCESSPCEGFACDGGARQADAATTTMDASMASAGLDASAGDASAGSDWERCLDASRRLRERLADSWEDPRRCEQDSDCALRGWEVSCGPEGRPFFSYCPIGVHVESEDAFAAVVDGVAAAECSSLPSECVSAAMCPPWKAVCDGSRCVARDALWEPEDGGVDGGS